MNGVSFELMEGRYIPEPDIIFNHFELTHECKKYIHIVASDNEWNVSYRSDEHTVYLGLYLVALPQDIFEELIKYIFKNNSKIDKIYLKKCRNNYSEMLKEGNHYRIILPYTFNELMGRMGKKGQYNYKREVRLLKELGEIEYSHWILPDIPNEIVNRYFELKHKTHNRDYHMEPQTYIKTYNVSDAYAILLNRELIAVLFSCEQCECVYLENFSYDEKYEKYSVGFLIYVHFLKELIEKGKKELFLGGGDYSYKKRFASIEDVTYDGYIYKSKIKKICVNLKARIRHVASLLTKGLYSFRR